MVLSYKTVYPKMLNCLFPFEVNWNVPYCSCSLNRSYFFRQFSYIIVGIFKSKNLSSYCVNELQHLSQTGFCIIKLLVHRDRIRVISI